MERASQRINQIYLVGVDSDTEEARVGVDQLVLVPHHGVPEDASITKEGQVSHVLGVVELGRVDLANGVGLVGLDLAVDGDGELLASSEGVILDLLRVDALEVAALLLVGVGHPHALLGVVGLGLGLLLHVVLHLQPWGWIWIGSGGLLNVSGHGGGRESETKGGLHEITQITTQTLIRLSQLKQFCKIDLCSSIC